MSFLIQILSKVQTLRGNAMFKFIISILLCAMSFSGFTAEIIEGQDYELIKRSQGPSTDNKMVPVTEFFSYGCPWCARLDKSLSAWVEKKGKVIHFTKVPVVFNDHWAYYARAYYVVQSLSLKKSVHDALFKAIVIDKLPMNNTQAMVAFFTKNGVDPVVAESAFAHTPSIEIKLKADQGIMLYYQINAVPTIVVNGMYKTNLQMAKTEARLFEILDYLVAKSKPKKMD